MSVDAQWPNLPSYGRGGFTAEEHAAHRSPKGLAKPEDLYPGLKSHKLAKLAMKIGHKPRLKFGPKSRTKTFKPKKKKK